MTPQLSVTLCRDEDGAWTVAAAVGERGLDHARDVNRSKRPLTAAAAEEIGRAVADAFDGSTGAQIRDFGAGLIA